jgi:putative lumazine-binding protein
MRIALALAVLAVPLAGRADDADREQIKAAALDYIEGWYAGDAARMEHALHPELAKRVVMRGPQGDRLGQMSALSLINGTRDGGGKKTPPAEQQKDVTVLDVYEGAAVAKIVASGWVDYLSLARWNGKWKIVNVLWELKPRPAEAAAKK